MAVITPSALISEIRGSVGSQTFSRNHYGAYVKGKLVQTNPDTIPQQAVRTNMADAVLQWQQLDQSEQDEWMQYVSQQLVGKNISRKIRRTAINEYTSRWMNRFAVGGVPAEFAPLPKVRLNPVITSVTQGTGSIVVNIDTLRPVGDCDIVIYATHPISPGINMINQSFYRIIGVLSPAAQVDSVDIWTEYNALFPLTIGDIGKKIGIAIRAINTDNFAAGQFFFVPAIISAIPVELGELVQLYNAGYYNSEMISFIKRGSGVQSHMNKTRGKLWTFFRY